MKEKFIPQKTNAKPKRKSQKLKGRNICIFSGKCEKIRGVRAFFENKKTLLKKIHFPSNFSLPVSRISPLERVMNTVSSSPIFSVSILCFPHRFPLVTIFAKSPRRFLRSLPFRDLRILLQNLPLSPFCSKTQRCIVT